MRAVSVLNIMAEVILIKRHQKQHVMLQTCSLQEKKKKKMLDHQTVKNE